MSETAMRKHLVEKYCEGTGVDIGCGDDPVVPWAIQVDPLASRNTHIRRDGAVLPFKDRTLDFVFSSHLIEDYLEWDDLLREWIRVLRPGGHLIIFVPDHTRFRAAVAAGQGDNPHHKHESFPGELTTFVTRVAPDMVVLEDRLTECWPTDYNIMFVARRA